MRTFIALSLIISMFGGAVIWNEVQPVVYEVIEYVEYLPYPEIHEVRTTVYNREVNTEIIIERVPDYKLKEFPSKKTLIQWLADNRIPQNDDWVCVDYVMELQRLAFADGYLLGYLIVFYDKQEGRLEAANTGHMMNAVVIGDNIYFIEASSNGLGKLKVKLGGVKG